jgi:hypothetical protein
MLSDEKVILKKKKILNKLIFFKNYFFFFTFLFKIATFLTPINNIGQFQYVKIKALKGKNHI